MEQLFNICVALSIGVLGGIVAGAVKAAWFKRSKKAIPSIAWSSATGFCWPLARL